MVERTISIEQCLAQILSHSSLQGGWHLRKTNWCWEAANIFEDEEISLEAAGIQDGDFIMVEEGKLPPKGFIRLPIYLMTSIQNKTDSNEDDEYRNQELHQLEENIDAYLKFVATRDSKSKISIEEVSLFMV